jgi:hypothetical protein
VARLVLLATAVPNGTSLTGEVLARMKPSL